MAKTGQEVLSICNEEAPDLFILDSELPFLAELEVLKRLRERYPRIPVVIHSFTTPENGGLIDAKSILFVEKTGDTGRLKTVVAEVIGAMRPGVSI